jgi:hypothetical protein
MKFVRMRHTILKDDMIRGSKISLEISHDEKRVCAPTLIVFEPFFSVPIIVAAHVSKLPQHMLLVRQIQMSMSMSL